MLPLSKSWCGLLNAVLLVSIIPDMNIGGFDQEPKIAPIGPKRLKLVLRISIDLNLLACWHFNLDFLHKCRNSVYPVRFPSEIGFLNTFNIFQEELGSRVCK